MKTAIEKMIKEYEEKIDNEDILLTSVYDKITTLKREKDCSFDRFAMWNMVDLKDEQRMISARRQAYVQAKSDFDNLLDYI